MQAMRELLRTTLARSLDGLLPLDRLSAAWPVATGHAVAERSSVTELSGTVATVTVVDANWLRQLRSTEEQLRAELARVSRVPLTDILFVLPAGADLPRTSATSSRRKTA
jgi:predicted nucleic acid-binding Zn ribbon protein